MSHSHAPGTDAPVRVPPRVQKLLLLALAPFLAATVIGLVVLWPEDRRVDLGANQIPAEQYGAVASSVVAQPCPALPGQEKFRCARVTVEVSEGPDRGHRFSFDYSGAPTERGIREGDRIVVGRASESAAAQDPQSAQYYFIGHERGNALLVLGIVFAIVVVALSRWRGVTALAGLAVSLLILIEFVLPAILQGENPLAVASVGGAAIMFLALYLAHGLNAGTTTAVLGTLTSLLLTGLLALGFVAASRLTGFGSEEATYLQVTQQQVNLQGLLLGSIVIGTLGVLDDVTVTQASAVWELHRANPSYGVANLFRAGIRIGRDHIASTVNTLVLAYAGASLPLLILFTLSNRSLGQVLTTEVVAQEVVRTLVGSIGLVASVPITTGLAALVVTAGAGADAPTSRRVKRDRRGKDDDSFRLPKAEREWRVGS